MKLLRSASLAARLVSALMAGILILFISTIVFSYFDNATDFTYVRLAFSFEQKILAAVKANVPTVIGGKDVAQWIIIIGSTMASIWTSGISRRIHEKYVFQEFRRNLDDWKMRAHLSDNSLLLSPLNEKIEQFKTARRKDREQLLREFAET